MQSFYGSFGKESFSSGGSHSSCPPKKAVGRSRAFRPCQRPLNQGEPCLKRLFILIFACRAGKSFYTELWSKRATPIFMSPSGRSEAALLLDRRLRAAESVPQLGALLEMEMDVGNVVIALSAAARVADERTLPTLRFGYPAYGQLLARALEAIEALEPRGLAMAAHAAAKLSWRQAAEALAAAAASRAPELTAQELAKICWALAKLEVLQHSTWRSLAQQLALKVEDLRPVDLSMLAWAFGTCELEKQVVEPLASQAERLMAELTPQCLANIAAWTSRAVEPETPYIYTWKCERRKKVG